MKYFYHFYGINKDEQVTFKKKKNKIYLVQEHIRVKTEYDIPHRKVPKKIYFLGNIEMKIMKCRINILY